MPKYQKDDLPHKYQQMYSFGLTAMTPEAFDVWCENAIASSDKVTMLKPLPDNAIKKTPQVNVKNVISQARDAVSGYSTSNGARKAVEALADALEQII